MTAARLRSIEVGRPLAASLILAGLLVAASAVVAITWTDLATEVDERDAKADILAHSVDASRRTALASGEGRRADPFVAAETETLAAAAVDAVVRSTVIEAGSSLLSSRAETKPDDGGIAGRIEAQAEIVGSNDALQAILLKLENRTPLMIVDDLSIVPADDTGDMPAPKLHMSVTLSAFWRKAARQ